MDPLSISASAVALITVCVETVKIIKKTIETVKTAKRELLNILNETNRMRLLLDQLRGLTHQLGSKNNEILLAFDKAGCEDVLNDLRRLVDKLSQADKFIGFQFLVRKSKIETLLVGLRTQEDGIRTVLLSVATESAVFTRDFVQTLIDGANVQAISITSITQSSVTNSNEPPPPFTELPEPPPSQVIVTTRSTEVAGQAGEGEDVIALAENDLPSTSDPAANTATDSNDGLWSPLTKHVSDLWQPTSTPMPPETHAGGSYRSDLRILTRILSETPVWHGQLARYLYDDIYLKRRDKLADAAFYGNWDAIEAYVIEARSDGFNSWPNCYRIGGWRGPSGWTPLHQAAFLGAPESIVCMLINHGALRTLQTLWTSQKELPYRNMTALEMAQFLGFRHLYNALSPVIRHHIPCATLDTLQQHFHTLIKDQLAGQREGANLRLPELGLLTELENPEMYFPLQSPKIAMGYFYRLDGRELVTMSIGIPSSSWSQCFRITERGVQQIQDAVLFDMK